MAGGVAFEGILLLALLSAGSINTDLVVLIQPQHYFESRQVEVSIDKMMELASQDPKDAKTQIMQLSALRYLTDESENLRKSPKYAAYRQTLEQIAQGKKAHDALDFSNDYAGWLLTKLDGSKIAAKKPALLREDAIAWFPTDASLLGALDTRQVRNFGTGQDPIRELLKLMPDREKKEMYNVFEQSGNIRLERLSVAFADNAKVRDQQKIMFRLTGKANQAWLADMIKTVARGEFEAKEMKDAKGIPMTILQPRNRPPVIALIGNTDMIMVGYGTDKGKHEELLTTMLAVRAKKQAGAATGPLKKELARVPDKAVAFFVGELPEDMKREFRFVLDPLPAKIVAHVQRDVQGLDVNVETTMTNPEDADKLVAKIGALRKEGIQSLQQIQLKGLPPGSPPIPFAALINLMESLQVQSKSNNVQLRLVVPDNLMQQLGSMMMMIGRF